MAEAAEFVYVGSKVPYAVILNLTSYEVVSKEHGVVQRKGDDLPTVTLKGAAVAFGKQDLSIDGFVFTKVPKDFWDEWVKTHSDFPMLKDGYIKAAKTLADGRALAREHVKQRGMNAQLLPEGDERVKGLKVKPYDQKDEAA